MNDQWYIQSNQRSVMHKDRCNMNDTYKPNKFYASRRNSTSPSRSRWPSGVSAFGASAFWSFGVFYLVHRRMELTSMNNQLNQTLHLIFASGISGSDGVKIFAWCHIKLNWCWKCPYFMRFFSEKLKLKNKIKINICKLQHHLHHHNHNKKM